MFRSCVTMPAKASGWRSSPERNREAISEFSRCSSCIRTARSTPATRRSSSSVFTW